jgi:hypothetical protein
MAKTKAATNGNAKSTAGPCAIDWPMTSPIIAGTRAMIVRLANELR